jgi:methanogenic corrinoid protein MtbC1
MERNGKRQRAPVEDGAQELAGHEPGTQGERGRQPGMALPTGDDPDARLARLARTIDREIIPRLVLSRRSVPRCPIGTETSGRQPGSEEIAQFTEIVLTHDELVATAYVESLRVEGASLESLFLGLLAPTARRLGELWQSDLCDFAEVTMGCWRLQSVMRSLSPAFRREVPSREQGKRALLVPAPGEAHSFGLLMVAEFFRRAGWDVWSGPLAATDDLVALVRNERFDVAGLSVGCETRLDALSANIHAIRRTSRNRNIGVLVGGPVFNDHPEYVSLVGADATALNGQQAVAQAQSLQAMLGTGE